MKAKKILSLLLTVAMIIVCSVTAFAAPAGYVQTATTALNGVDGETLATGTSLPDLQEIYAQPTVTPITDEEFTATYGAPPSDWGAPEGSSAYLVKLAINKLGTLSQSMEIVSGRPSYSGLKIVKIEAKFHYGEGVSLATDYKSDYSGINTQLPHGDCATASANMDTYYQFTYSNAGANTAYPSTNGTYADASIDNVISLVFFAKPGATVTLNNISVGYANYTSGTAGGVASIAVWHPATITLGEAPEPELDTTIKAVEDDETGALVMEYGANVDAANKTLAGQYIVIKDAVVAANALTEKTRVKVTYDDPAAEGVEKEVTYGKSIYEHLNITGEGQTYTKSLAFGIVYEDPSYKADYFTFEVFEQE